MGGFLLASADNNNPRREPCSAVFPRARAPGAPRSSARAARRCGARAWEAFGGFLDLMD